MTLTEHACKIYGEKVQEAGELWKVPIGVMELAYNELRDTLDAERAKPKADPDLDRIKREREVAHAALNQIHTAFGDPRCGLFNPTAIAERAVEAIKKWRCWRLGDFPSVEDADMPEPPEKAVYEWTEWVLRRNGQKVGDCWMRDTYTYGWVVRRATVPPIDGQAKTLPLAKAAVEAVVRAHYGDDV